MTIPDGVIEGCKNGDAMMQRELYRMYSPRFYSLCRRYTSSDDTAQSVLLEGFLDVFRNINAYRGDGTFEGWMQKIFIRKTIRENERRKRNRLEYGEIDALNTTPIEEDIEKRIDIRDALVDSLRQLTYVQQTVFNMVAVEGYTIDEAAKLMKLNASTLKTHYYAAREKMKTLITLKLGIEYIDNLINKAN